jgi:hypothetical protein
VTDEEFEADERIVRLRFLHEVDADHDTYGPYCPECSDPENGMYVVAPCLTIRTLNGEVNWMNTPDELSTLA